MRANPPETVKNSQFRRKKQLIFLILKQIKYIFYDQQLLSCYLYENSMNIVSKNLHFRSSLTIGTHFHIYDIHDTAKMIFSAMAPHVFAPLALAISSIDF